MLLFLALNPNNHDNFNPPVGVIYHARYSHLHYYPLNKPLNMNRVLMPKVDSTQISILKCSTSFFKICKTVILILR